MGLFGFGRKPKTNGLDPEFFNDFYKSLPSVHDTRVDMLLEKLVVNWYNLAITGEWDLETFKDNVTDQVRVMIDCARGIDPDEEENG